MIILGLALRQDALSDEFNRGGVLETTIMSINNIFNMEGKLGYPLPEYALNDDIYDNDLELDSDQKEEADILFRREHHDGSTIDNLRELTSAKVGSIDDAEEFHGVKIGNYTIDDKTTEQNGGPSDDNLSTAGGWRKDNKCDPDAHEKNERKKLDRYAFNQIIHDQQIELNKLLSAIEVEISKLENKLEEHNDEIKELEKTEAELDGDISGNSASASKRRSKIQTVAQARGIKLEDHKHPDGTIDHESLRQAVKEDIGKQKEIVVEKRDEVQKELTQLEEEAREIRSTLNRDDNKYETALASGDQQAITEAKHNLEKNSIQGSDYLFQRKTDEEKLEEYTSELDEKAKETASLTDIDDMIAQEILELDNNSLFSFPDMNEAIIAKKEPESSNADIGYGLNHNLATFAANDDDHSTHNIISKVFAIASDPETKVQQLQDNKYLEQNLHSNPAIYKMSNGLT